MPDRPPAGRARRALRRADRHAARRTTGTRTATWPQHEPLAKKIDKPIAGLLTDLKQPRHARRHAGRLDDRVRPHAGPGRRRRAAATTRRASRRGWPAAASRAGIAYGETDDIGATVAEKKVHVHDFHATILHLLGLDHEQLTYRHAGRDFRLTDVHGNVVKDILA